MRVRLDHLARKSRGYNRGAWLWLLVVLAWVANLGHLTLVSHTVCRDHGKLVHVDEHHDEVVAPASTSGPSADADHSGDHEHDHCWAHADDLVQTATPHVGAFSTIAWTSSSWPHVARAPFAARLFLRAPKTSPPHVA